MGNLKEKIWQKLYCLFFPGIYWVVCKDCKKILARKKKYWNANGREIAGEYVEQQRHIKTWLIRAFIPEYLVEMNYCMEKRNFRWGCEDNKIKRREDLTEGNYCISCYENNRPNGLR